MKLRFLLCLLLMVGLVTGAMTNIGYAAPSIIDFELEIDLKNGNKYDLEYEVKGSAIEAKYQVPGEPVVYGQDAASKVQDFMSKLALTPSSNRDEVINTTLSQLGLNKNDVKEFELEVDFDNGQELDIEFKG